MDFIREPRVPAPPMAFGAVSVDAPPPVPPPAAVNPVARLLPVAMLVAAVGMMAVYVTSGSATRNPMYMFFPVMMLTSVLGTLAYGARGSNRTADINKGRQKYLHYIDGVDAEAATTADAQRRASAWCHPEPQMLWTLAGGRRMWERSSGDPDFCLIRVGSGVQPLSTVADRTRHEQFGRTRSRDRFCDAAIGPVPRDRVRFPDHCASAAGFGDHHRR